MRLEVIIKDKETGEVLNNVECDSVICGYSGSASERVNNSGQSNIHKGNGISVLMAIQAAEEAVECAKESICADYKEDTGIDVSWNDIKRIVGMFTRKIKVDEDAIKAMMEVSDDENE